MKRFYQQINKAWSKVHGRHRNASPATHSDPADRAGGCAGGAGAGGAFTSSTAITIYAPFTLPEPEPPTVPYAGVRTGELTGHRLWWLLPNGSISSLAHLRVWEPDETVHGDLYKPVCVDDWASYVIWGGVYSYAAPDPLPFEIGNQLENCRMWKKGLVSMMGSYWNPYRETGTLVSGTIKMWGDVIEHDHGYRAEFAKLTSIAALHGKLRVGDLEVLRARYGV